MTDPTSVDLSATNQLRQRGTTRHGLHRFDLPLISHIGDNLYQGGCINGTLLPGPIENLLSLYAGGSYVTHPLVTYRRAPFPDDIGTDLSAVDDLARWVNERAELGPTLVNCEIGLNRSGLVIARALILQGYSPASAIALIRAQRSPYALCNPYFESWLLAQAPTS